MQGTIKSRGFYHKSYVDQVTVGNFDDDIATLRDCDWVVEVVVENMAIKKSLLLEKIIPNIDESTILTTNTSGLSINEMAEILRRSGLLKYQDPPEGGLDLIGGNESVKRHITRDKACLSEDARSFGIDPPRGLLLTGIPGCGKTQISLCTASAWARAVSTARVPRVLPRLASAPASCSRAIHSASLP